LVRGNKDGTTGVHRVISVIERRVRELENGAIQVFGLVAKAESGTERGKRDRSAIGNMGKQKTRLT
jgi:hypothetical protein